MRAEKSHVRDNRIESSIQPFILSSIEDRSAKRDRYSVIEPAADVESVDPDIDPVHDLPAYE
jgi:hypothetical protein